MCLNLEVLDMYLLPPFRGIPNLSRVDFLWATSWNFPLEPLEEIVVDLDYLSHIVSNIHVRGFLQKESHPGFLFLEGVLREHPQGQCMNSLYSVLLCLCCPAV